MSTTTNTSDTEHERDLADQIYAQRQRQRRTQASDDDHDTEAES